MILPAASGFPSMVTVPLTGATSYGGLSQPICEPVATVTRISDILLQRTDCLPVHSITQKHEDTQRDVLGQKMYAAVDKTEKSSALVPTIGAVVCVHVGTVGCIKDDL